MRPVLAAFLMLFTAACANSHGASTSSASGDGWANGPTGRAGPNILILGQDGDPQSVARNNSAFGRVLNAVSNELHDEGFRVYDETTLTIDTHMQHRMRRMDAEVIGIARSIKHTPIDVAVLYTLYAHGQDRAYAQKMDVRVMGRLIAVRTGERIGNFEAALPTPIAISPDCDGACMDEALGDHAHELAQELGAVLAARIRAHVSGSPRVSAEQSPKIGLPTSYTLTFEGFSAQDIDRIEHDLTQLEGYAHHRLLRSGYQLVVYWYETAGKEAYLTRALQQVVEDTDNSARLTFNGSAFHIVNY
ncbi:hypothetical protein V5T82_15045 [Magnetovibrio sp. PR-2]|uniref:hypothetical protein n=1 Tax=Magnetovibrio sp. PR-2 TaxID=3120356 RepID=UPI002FCE4198